jgi:hypothetical protein
MSNKEERELEKIEAELKKVGSKVRKEQHKATDEFIKNLVKKERKNLGERKEGKK